MPHDVWPSGAACSRWAGAPRGCHAGAGSVSWATWLYLFLCGFSRQVGAPQP
ncbi:GlyGly-CTERM sorting domain-containing protein [bacterium]|nr:MAG: GlyGly-CTERM sorting domain-containing protein [bacterium]